MGYQPTIRPELLYPPGNPDVYCGECNAKIDDGLGQCPKCGTLFPLFPSRLYEDDPFALDKRLLGEPTYGVLIEDLRLSIGHLLLCLQQWLTNHILDYLGHLLSRFLPDPKPELDFNSMLEEKYTGEYDSHVPLILSGEQGTELFSAKMLTAGKVTMIEAINNMRAIHGYEPLPEEPQADHQEMQYAPADWRSENYHAK